MRLKKIHQANIFIKIKKVKRKWIYYWGGEKEKGKKKKRKIMWYGDWDVSKFFSFKKTIIMCQLTGGERRV